MITTAITVERTLRDYLYSKYYDSETDTIRFPPTEDVYHILRDLLQRRPAGVSPIDTGNLVIALPDTRIGKDPAVFNYLSIRSTSILKQKLQEMMSAELHGWIDHAHHTLGLKYKDALYSFMVNFNIDESAEDALWKNYQRWRDRVRRHKKRKRIS